MTVGFTAGIAVIIFASQLKELLGLTLEGKEPGPLIPKLIALAKRCRDQPGGGGRDGGDGRRDRCGAPATGRTGRGC